MLSVVNKSNEKNYYLKICFAYGLEQTIVDKKDVLKDIRKKLTWAKENGNTTHHIYQSGIDMIIDPNLIIIMDITDKESDSYL